MTVIPKYLKTYFKSLEEEHGIFLEPGQKLWYAMKYKELGDDIKREYPSTPEESFMGSNEGFWYAKEMNVAQEDGRITQVPFQKNMQVYTAWDIGFGDPTAIWFFQLVPTGSINIIDYYENQGEGLIHYITYLQKIKYSNNYAKHFFPHDAAAHDKGSGLSLEKQAKDLGMKVQVLDRYNTRKSSFVIEVQRCRNMISQCYFDEEKCAAGINSLRAYKKRWNEKMAFYTDEPVHDQHSHAADAFRYMAQAIYLEINKSSQSALEKERQKIARARMGFV